jgi:hypothetical protein
MSKRDQLRKLAILRKNSIVEGCKNIHEFQNGAFDKEFHVSPWTNSAKNVDSNLMLLGQDWVGSDWLSDPDNLKYADIGMDPTFQTNKNIEKYLKFFDLEFKDIYATNAFVFVKNGSMSSSIEKKIFNASILTYAIPQIEIVRPKMVICLGAITLNAVRKAIHAKPIRFSSAHIDYAEYKGIKIFGTSHPGGMGTAMAGGAENAEDKWKILAKEYNEINETNG